MRHTRSLGQYFTPRPVVRLCYRMLQVLDPKMRRPRIIDPACGDGAFLQYAVEQGIALGDRLFGIERDPDLASAWKASGLSDQAALFTHDGLFTDADTPGVEDDSFDWVVGNPPFGRDSLASFATPACRGEASAARMSRGAGCSSAEASPLAHALDTRYTIWRHGGIRRVRQLATYPIEILFLERFLQLAIPGGRVAMVIPDGMLANARLAYVREWLAERAAVLAVVSLPQSTFVSGGASSKASILALRKNPAERASVFMASLESNAPVEQGIEPLVRALAGPMDTRAVPPWSIFTALPADRLDPAYHHPRYEENLRMLSRLPNVVPFADLIEFTTYGQVGPREYTESGVRHLSPANMRVTSDGLVTGIDFHARERFVLPGSRNDPPRSRLRRGDLLLSNSGVGCIGRPAVFLSDESCNISQHINVVRVRGVEPEYLAVYLQTQFARLQIDREKCGVGPSGINFDRIKSILVPILPEKERRPFVEGYLAMMEQPPSESASTIRELVQTLECLMEKG